MSGEAPTSTGEVGELTVLFVDLARFTSLTDIHGDVTAADAATSLKEVSQASLFEEARLVKSVGDGVLITAASPAAGLRCASAIIEGLHDLGTGLDARGGLDHGSIVVRNGDVFGSTVNLAARVAELPAAGGLAMTRPVAEAAGEVDLAVTPIGKMDLKGFRTPIEVFEVDPCIHGDDWLVDPVCGMRVRAEDAIDTRMTKAGSVGFCSQRCADLYGGQTAPQ